MIGLNSEQPRGTRSLAGNVAVVTGATSGIGRAIALALSRQGVQVYAIGRDPKRLAETVEAAREFSPITGVQIDLATDGSSFSIVRQLQDKTEGLDILVHSAGLIHQDTMEHARVEDLDAQYAINVRAPYILTKSLLPFIKSNQGQIVFVNSSAGLSAKRPEVGQYAATKHALKAIADSLREEVNPRGIRVLSIYLGRTATPMQEALYRKEGKDYHPGSLIQPHDVACAVVQALMLPVTVEVTDVSMRPMLKSYS
jgi:NADP-dependent 3-hydroxy acid dehydrogenase YdfG